MIGIVKSRRTTDHGRLWYNTSDTKLLCDKIIYDILRKQHADIVPLAQTQAARQVHLPFHEHNMTCQYLFQLPLQYTTV